MNWPPSFTSIPEGDLDKVFQYSPQETIIVFLCENSTPRLWLLQKYDDWTAWLAKGRPFTEANSPGLVLILARRAGEKTSLLEDIRTGVVGFGHEKEDANFLTSSDEKDGSHSWPVCGKLHRSNHPRGAGRDTQVLQSGGREAGQVPFEKEVFREVCSSFFIHPSIARVISRADSPLFSRGFSHCKDKPSQEGSGLSTGNNTPAIGNHYVNSKNMHHRANANALKVYNCRTANTWMGDLALSVTSFPDSELTYGVLFGCTADVEREVLNRLSNSTRHCGHPLLLPGILAELERERMLKVVEATAKQVNEIVFELDTGAATYLSDEEREVGAREERRTVWLNSTFLRNRLNLWRNQLIKMAGHMQELSCLDSKFAAQRLPMTGAMAEAKTEQMIESTFLIKDRLQDIIDEFQMHIDDCTMRIEDMSMATQWSNGNINVDIAASTGKDSNQMRSIALVTMIFLPGTFFATLFSMTFFNWTDGGKDVVSSYIWIYFVITGVFTFLTLFAWWYFLSPWRPRSRNHSEVDSLV